MTPLTAVPNTSSVVLADDALLIRDLAVDGPALEAARRADDPEMCIRRMLEIGGSVLLAAPHGDLLDQVDARVGRLIDALDQRADGMARLRAVSDAGAAKGVAFEDLAGPIIERCFAPFGDIVEDTSRVVGADGRCKAGDLTVTIGATADTPPRRIAFEFKDRPTLKIGGKDGALAAIDLAMANREADVGVLVCSSAAPALEAQRLCSYPGARLIVLLDKDDPEPLPLEMACQLARALATCADALGRRRRRQPGGRWCAPPADDSRSGCRHQARLPGGLSWHQRVESGYTDLVAEAAAVIDEMAVASASR